MDTYLQTKYWHALHEIYFWFLRFRKLTCSVDLLPYTLCKILMKSLNRTSEKSHSIVYVRMIHGRATKPLIKTIKGWGQICLSRFHLVCSNRVFSALLQRSKSWIKCWNTSAKYNKIGKRQILKKKSAAIQFSLVLSCATIHKYKWHEKTMRTDVFFSCFGVRLKVS